MKTLNSLLILVVMVLPVAVQAQFTFITNADNATLTITGYTGPGGAVTIPAAINSYPVISIGTNAFAGLSDLTNVTITGGITSIDEGAFQNCTNLTGVYFQGNAPSADTTVFAADSAATAYYLMGTAGWGATFGVIPTAPWNTQPLILTQTTSQTNLAGSTVSFNITAEGTTPLAFQWLFNGYPLSNGGEISGSATTSLVLTGITLNDAGNYAVIITNSYGSVTSSVVTLSLSDYVQTWDLTADWNPPANPNGAWSYGEISGGVFTPLAWVGGNTSGSTDYAYGSASGGFVYQNTNAVTFDDIDPGQISLESDWGSAAVRWTAPTAGAYNLTVSIGGSTQPGAGGYGNNFASDAALNINGVSQSASAFLNNVMSWNLTGVVLNAGTTVDAFVTNPGYANGGNTEVTFTVNLTGAPVIVTQPASQLCFAGSPVQFNVTANGESPLTFKWFFNGSPLADGGEISGAATTNLLLSSTTTNDAGNYSVIITNSYGSATSQVAVLTVALPPAITTQPVSQTNLSGTAATFNVSVGGTGPFTYQWEFNGTNLPNDIITTVAGNGTNNYSGDDGAATNASLSYPKGVVLDASGNLYIDDYQNNLIRLVSTNGIITRVAGNGTYGFAGDGGAATSASLSYPEGVALDAFGNLYIADSQNNRIRMVSTSGVITTVAGNGYINATNDEGGYSGDGGAATNASLNYPNGVAVDAFGNLYIADSQNNRIRMVSTNGVITTVAGNGYINATNDEGGYSGDGGAATNASLNYPRSVAVDALGNLYIADSANGRVRVVNTNGIITTVAGGGNGGDGGAATNASLAPSGMAFDAFGNLYIADDGNSRIRMVNTNGIITIVAGNGTAAYGGDGGAATNASLDVPTGVTFDAFGNMYIGDTLNNRIRKVLPNSGFPRLTLGNIGTTNAGNYSVVITSPYGSVTSAVVTLTVLLPPTIGTQPASQVAVVGSSPGFSVIATGTPPLNYSWYFNTTNLVQSGTNSLLTLPYAAVSNSGSYVVVITNSYGSVTSQVATLTIVPCVITSQPTNQIAKVGGSPSLTVAVAGSGPFAYEWYLAGTNLVQNGTNNTLTVPNISPITAGNYTVVITNNYGSVTSQVAAVTLQAPPTVATQPSGQTNLAGTTVTFNVTAGITTPGPFGYQWQLNGTNLPNGIITTVAGNGTTAFAGDGGNATNASLDLPYGAAFDADGNLYIADTSHHRIRMVSPNGVITTVAGNGTGTFAGDGGPATIGSLDLPQGVALDAAGNLYIADTSNSRIRKVATNGIITTVAGKGGSSYSGDGGAATNAGLSLPSGVAVDTAGNLYIADKSNNRVRKVATNGIISTVAGNGTTPFAGDGGAATNASLYLPSGLVFDALGNLYIADQDNDRVRRVATNGIVTTVAGTGTATYAGDGGAATNAGLNLPFGVALDSYGNLYIADQNNSRVRRVNANGIITTVAGKNGSGFTGDGGTATNASLNLPTGMALDLAGNLYIADKSNSRIRRVWLYAGNPTLVLNQVTAANAGNYTVVITNSYGSVTSAVAALTVVYPPTISAQPASQFATVGSNVTLAVTASGTGVLGYSWYEFGSNLLQSGAGSTLALAGVTTGNAGNYTVVITNNYGSVTSQVAVLSVGYPPTVLIPPGSQTDLVGSPVIFNIQAGGTAPFAYQWLHNGTNLPTNIITTWAGNGTSTNGGDGGTATNASLNYPEDIIFDATGNMYIAEAYNSRIRKVDTNGIITLVAGKGTAGYAGDGGAATNALLDEPTGVALDAAGNLYIADWLNFRVRMVNTNGIITTVAGNGSRAYAGDGGLATNADLSYPTRLAFDTAGNLFIADSGNNRVRKLSVNGIITTVAGNGTSIYSGDGGQAANAGLYWPAGLTFDTAGNLYIADNNNNRIRKVAVNGIITTLAGKGGAAYAGDGGAATNASVNAPNAMKFDVNGNLYIADSGNDRIRLIKTNGIISTVAGNSSAAFTGDGGTATNASLNYPIGMTLDTQGNLYIGDSGNKRIRNVQFSGYPSLVLTNASATNAGNYSVVITSPYGSVTSAVATLTLEFPPKISTQPASQLVVVGSSPSFSVLATGDVPLIYLWYINATNLVQSSTASTLTLAGVAVSNSGNYTVVITNNYGSVTSQVAALTVGLPPTLVTQPVSLTNVAGTKVSFNAMAGGTGPFTYQWQFNGTNLPNGIITTVAGNGTSAYAGDGGAATDASLYYPHGVALDAFGNLYIADTKNSRIRMVDTNGIITTVAGNGSYSYTGDGGVATNASLYYPSGVALDAYGNLYIADLYNNRIRMVATNGVITTVAGNGTNIFGGDGGAATNAILYYPLGVAFDAFGNLYIADQYNNRIRKVDTNGIITTVAGNGTNTFAGDGGAATNASLDYPTGVAFDAHGALYIADSDNNRIRMVNTNGVITTVAGNGKIGYTGDGGAAINSSLYYPTSVAIDSLGNIYIADSSYSRIRMVATNGVITTIAGNGSYYYTGDGGAATNASLNSPEGVAFDALGNLYIADTYNDRIREVQLNAGYPTFTLGNIGVTNAGNYSVVISSPYGSVTSAVAVLTVMVPTNAPQILVADGSFGFSTNQFGFNFSGLAGQMVVVEGSTNLLDWTPLFTNSANGGPVYFFDPGWTNFPWRFYRARLP